MKEIEVLLGFVKGFGKYKDFTIESEFPVQVGDKQIRTDSIIIYKKNSYV